MKLDVIYRVGLALVLGMLLQGTALGNEDKPFAERRVVLQVSDASPQKQTLVLNVANNLIRHYGPDSVDVELVAFGPGLKLLLADNPNAERVSNLAANGIRFRACKNTYRNMTRKTGSEPTLNREVRLVPAGIVQILDRVAEGYTLVRP